MTCPAAVKLKPVPVKMYTRCLDTGDEKDAA